ncbi:MAG: hypothetical protein ACRBCT_01990 [Alphaproteobacteria bacterium]
MAIDSEQVLKSFGQTSETQFSLLYALQLFIACEEDKSHAAYDIAGEDAFRLCAAPGRLGKNLVHIRDFILWQRNILKLDDGEILETELPRGLKHKYPVKASRLAEEPSREVRESGIKTLLDEIDAYMAKFNEVRAILEATEDRFLTVEETLSRAESLDEGVAGAMKDQKAELERMRIALTDLRGDLEDPTLPDLIKFADTPKAAWGLMKHLSAVNLQAREAIRRYQLAETS